MWPTTNHRQSIYLTHPLTCGSSCTKAGYFKDDFIHHFVRKASRRSPLINRGAFGSPMLRVTRHPPCICPVLGSEVLPCMRCYFSMLKSMERAKCALRPIIVKM